MAERGSEVALVEWLRRKTRTSRPNVVLGIGDDCAIYRPRGNEDLVITTDQFIQEVHFTLASTPQALGQRALARSLSDIAAMGAIPRFCLVSLALPAATTDAWTRRFFGGLLTLARTHNVTLAGGDLSHDTRIHADVMICGSVPKGNALRRDGARAGDSIYVSGKLGKGWDSPIHPQLALGQKLRNSATACMDVSDGLSLDLHRMCVASGVAAELDTIPIAENSSLEQALHQGEDYELLFTLPDGKRAPGNTTRIGSIVKGRPGLIYLNGHPLTPQGYDHFAKR